MSFCRLLLAALILLAALLALPISLAWSAASSSMPATSAVRPLEWAQPLDKRINLYRMEPNLYRSALPDSNARPLLDDLGIVTVINFYQRSDASWLPASGMQQIHLPLRTNRIDDADVIEVLRSIRQAQGHGNVLIHCKHGQNRTGLIAALYRVVYQGWSKEQALAEMRSFGGGRRLEDAERYLQRVDIGELKIALETGACSTNPWALCEMKAWLAKVFSVRAT
ncbi:protein-tyrosine-phosphatase [Stutzerimonas xanthomarina]|nr:protein-tyrosine-phosphatase [Stutzerimonas xanthomarina]